MIMRFLRRIRMKMDSKETRGLMEKVVLNENVKTDTTSQEAVETYVNGNISDFKKYLKDCSKLDLCDVIEILRGQYGYKIHNIISILRQLLPTQ